MLLSLCVCVCVRVMAADRRFTTVTVGPSSPSLSNPRSLTATRTGCACCSDAALSLSVGACTRHGSTTPINGTPPPPSPPSQIYLPATTVSRRLCTLGNHAHDPRLLFFVIFLWCISHLFHSCSAVHRHPPLRLASLSSVLSVALWPRRCRGCTQHRPTPSLSGIDEATALRCGAVASVRGTKSCHGGSAQRH